MLLATTVGIIQQNKVKPHMCLEKKKQICAEAALDYIQNNDLSDPTHYDFVDQAIDMEEFLNYWIYSVYIAKYDWPANNLIVWKERKLGAKWRWGAIDHDGSTANGFSAETEPSFNTLEFVTDATSQVWPNHSSSTLFFRKLLDNTDFRNEYAQ